MIGGLAIAIVAEHVTTDAPLADIVARLGQHDRASLASEVLALETAVVALRDIAAPRRPDSSGDKSASVSREAASGTSIRNRYKGRCACGRHVPEGRGRAVKRGSKWITVCYPCAIEQGLAPKPPSPMTGVSCAHDLDAGLCADPVTHYPQDDEPS